MGIRHLNWGIWTFEIVQVPLFFLPILGEILRAYMIQIGDLNGGWTFELEEGWTFEFCESYSV